MPSIARSHLFTVGLQYLTEHLQQVPAGAHTTSSQGVAIGRPEQDVLVYDLVNGLSGRVATGRC
jgi:hypothetical protein